MIVDGFPSEPQRLSVFAALTDADRDGVLELQVVRLDTEEQIYAQRFPISFPDRSRVVNLHVRARRIRFPAAGDYEFAIFVDGEFVAHRRLRVYPV
jgi:hypothetical protein